MAQTFIYQKQIKTGYAAADSDLRVGDGAGGIIASGALGYLSDDLANLRQAIQFALGPGSTWNADTLTHDHAGTAAAGPHVLNVTDLPKSWSGSGATGSGTRTSDSKPFRGAPWDHQHPNYLVGKYVYRHHSAEIVLPSTPSTQGSVDVTSAIGSGIAPLSSSADGYGVVSEAMTAATNNINKVTLSRPTDGSKFLDGSGREIYGRLSTTGSGTYTHTLNFYVNISGTETAATLPFSTDFDFAYTREYDWDLIIASGSHKDALLDFSGASGSGGTIDPATQNHLSQLRADLYTTPSWSSDGTGILTTPLQTQLSTHEAASTDPHGSTETISVKLVTPAIDSPSATLTLGGTATALLPLTDDTLSIGSLAKRPTNIVSAGYMAVPDSTVNSAFQTFVSGDAQIRYGVLGSGLMQWGPGGATAPDTQLSRTGVGTLQLTTTLNVTSRINTPILGTTSGNLILFSTGGFILPQTNNSVSLGSDNFKFSTTTTHYLALRPTTGETIPTVTLKGSTDTGDRLEIMADGKLRFGDGAGTLDIDLFRAGANTLKLYNTPASTYVDLQVGNLTANGALTLTGGLTLGGALSANGTTPSYVLGNFGVGIASPENVDGFGRVLDVFGTASAKASVRSSGGIDTRIVSSDGGAYGIAPGGIVGTKSPHALTLMTSAVGRATLDTSGRFGIGTAVPSQSLTVGAGGTIATDMAAPGAVTASPSTSGGALATATYYYKITAFDGQGGESAASAEVAAAVTGPTGKVTLSWGPVPGAISYRVYRGTTAGIELFYYTAVSTSYSDTGSAISSGGPTQSPTALGLRLVPNGSSWLTGGLTRLGIGTSAPAQPLDVFGDIRTTGALRLYNANLSNDNQIIVGTNDAFLFTKNNSSVATGGYFGSLAIGYAANALGADIDTGGNLYCAGKVGVNVTSAADITERLTVIGSIKIASGTTPSQTGQLYFGDTGWGVEVNTGTGIDHRLKYTSDGASSRRIGFWDAHTASYILFGDTNQQLYIAANLSIGGGASPAAPTHRLEIGTSTDTLVGGGLSIGGDVEVYRSAANTLALASGDDLDLLSGNLKIGGTIVLDSSRGLYNLTVVGTNLVPDTDDVHTLGDPTHAWSDLYVVHLHMPTTGDLHIGTDVNLYRGGAATLTTDASLTVGGSLAVTGGLTVGGSAVGGRYHRESAAGDGTTVAFILAHPPLGSTVSDRQLQVFYDGVLMEETIDYTISGATVTFVTATTPRSGANLSFIYWY